MNRTPIKENAGNAGLTIVRLPIVRMAFFGLLCFHFGKNFDNSLSNCGLEKTSGVRVKNSKDYIAPSVTLDDGGDGWYKDMNVDTALCPASCLQCNNPKRKKDERMQAYQKKYGIFGVANAPQTHYCSGYCDASQNRCLSEASSTHTVDCTGCKNATQVAYFNAMEPIEGDADCKGIDQWGSGDDSKFLCKKLLSEWPDNCIIVSLGGNGKWGFERDAYVNSPCEIHTFDCTGSWAVPFEIGSRVTFHQKCIGTEEVAQTPDTTPRYGLVKGNRMITLSHVFDIVGGRPDYLKADIERYEWQLLPSMMASNPEHLPVQIQVEIHQVFPSSLSQLFQMLRKQYSVVKRHDNPFCPSCSEVLLVLTKRL